LNSDDGVTSALVGTEDVGEDVEFDQRTLADESSEVDETSTFEVVRSDGTGERDRVCRGYRDGRGEREGRCDDGSESRKAKHDELEGSFGRIESKRVSKSWIEPI